MGQRRHRLLSTAYATAAATVLVGTTCTAVAPSAFAADVTDEAALQASLTGEVTTTLTTSITTAGGSQVTVGGGSRTLDLGGYDLSLGCLTLPADGDLTITGTGTLTAAGCSDDLAGIGVPQGAELTIGGPTVNATSTYGAGIGGGYGQAQGGGDATGGSGGTITIVSGTVNAASTYGAGIGGGYGRAEGGGDATGGAGGTITITGGTTNVTTTNYGTGIGGGHGYADDGGDATGGAGGTIAITGGTVNVATLAGTGIGGGYSEVRDGGTATGGAGGTVTITGGTVDIGGGQESIGGGGAGAYRGFVAGGAGSKISISRATVTIGAGIDATGGSLDIGAGGVLVLPSWSRTVIPDGMTATNAGTIRGADAGDSLLSHGIIGVGSGKLINTGAITVPTANVHPAVGFVTGNNYLVRFHPDAGQADPVRVFAATADAGDRTLPTGPWFTSTGAAVTASTDLSPLAAIESDDQVVDVYQPPATIGLAADSAPTTTNQPVAFTVTGLRADGTVWGHLTDGVEFDYGDGTTGTDPSHAYTTSGQHTVTATWNGLTATTTVTVTAAPPAPGPAPSPAPSPAPAPAPAPAVAPAAAPAVAPVAATPKPVARPARTGALPATGVSLLPAAAAGVLFLTGVAALLTRRRTTRR